MAEVDAAAVLAEIPPQMNKAEISGVLEQIATLLELKDENPFKIRAYANAARAIDAWGGNAADLQDEEALRKMPGIGKAIAEKVKELATTGSLKFLDELRGEFPPGILELFSIPGLGAKKIKVLHEQLKVSSIAELHEACKSGRVAELAGFGETTQTKLSKSIETRMKHSTSFQAGLVARDAEVLREFLAGQPEALQVSLAGSYRRRREIVRDLDFIVATRKADEITNAFAKHPLVESIIAQGPTKTSVRLRSGVQCDLRVVQPDEYPFALNYFTGSKEHNIEMRSRALKRGWTLNEYRLAPLPADPKSGKTKPKTPPAVREESDLYEALGLDFVPAELRENNGEFEAAENHTLPRLIEKENLRGTFHCHTTASDGHSTLEEMAAAAAELGLEYLGIADHSRSSIQAHGLDETKLRTQGALIRKLNKTLDGLHVFAGVECDILRDGSLDFSDEILAELDYVVASVHSVFNLPEAEMTKRVIRAMENPHVTMLGHPTGRLLLKREGYAIDIPAVLDAAVATGTWIEINAAPKRLDLDWRWWPMAKEKGVKCVINPDAHRVERLQDLWFGVGVARKGWLTKSDVMNCLPLSKMEKELRRKREL